MNFYPYIPPLLALFLLLISKLQENYITSHITDAQTQNYALDAIARLEFFNGGFAAIVTVFVTYHVSQAFGLMTITALVILVLFIPMLLIMMAQKAGDLHGKRPTWTKLRYSTLTRIFLVIVNLILIGAIYADQQATKMRSSPVSPVHTTTTT